MSKLADLLAGAALRLAGWGWLDLSLQKNGIAPAIMRNGRTGARDPIRIQRLWRNRQCTTTFAGSPAPDLTVIRFDDERHQHWRSTECLAGRVQRSIGCARRRRMQ